MCELLGMSANVPTDICFSFTGLVQRGGGTGPHKDGWGITFTKVKAVAHLKIRNPALIPHRQTCPGLPDKILFGGGSYSPLIGARWRWKILTRLPASYGGVTGLMPIMDN